MKDSHVAVLLEDINSKFDVCVEMASDVADMKIQIAKIFQLFDNMDRRVFTVEAGFADITKQLGNHDVRITRLEAA